MAAVATAGALLGPDIRDVTPVTMPIVLVLVDAIERALALGGRPVDRLGRAKTSVAFVVDGNPAFILLLDRRPPELLPGGGPAEITVFLTGEQAATFALGQLNLPNELVAARVSCRGAVRRYLQVDVILRALLARIAATDEASQTDTGAGPAATYRRLS